MTFKTEQEAFWAGEFGSDYIGRNDSPELLARNLWFFCRALRAADRITSCIEFGANIGMNLRALRCLYPDVSRKGVEINAEAARKLAELLGSENVYHGSLFNWEPEGVADLALVKGLLIHLDPGMLGTAYRKIYEASRRWILLCEYYNPSPVAITYRGHKERLFKRDFAGEMLALYSDLCLVDYGFAYRHDPICPQDDITWFLLRKVT